MSKLWLVALNEYKRNVFKKSFLLALFSVPLMIGLNVAVVMLIIGLNTNTVPVGYVDHSGVLADPVPAPLRQGDKPVEFIPFQTEEDARAALEAEDIQAFYVLDESYLQTGQAELIYHKKPGENATSLWYDFLQVNLVSGYPSVVAHRVANGTDITIRSLDGSLEFPDSGPTIESVIPAFISLIFVFLLMMSSGYLMQAVSEEKENRTMEVLMTSVSPMQLIGGKVLGILGIGLTQLVTWVVVAIIGVYISGSLLDIAWFQNVTVDWGKIASITGLAIPSYVLASSLMISVGILAAQAQEAQSFSGMLVVPYFIPAWAITAIGNNPNGTVSLIMSLAPFTTLLTMGVRMMISVVPLWQILASIGVQCLFALGGVWLASRAFRLGMLRYGQRVRLKEVFSKAAVQGARSPQGAKS